MPAAITLDDLRTALTLTPAGAHPRGHLLTGGGQAHPSDRVFGGLLLAQAVMAAGQASPPGLLPVSLQADFLVGVPAGRPITWLVEDLGTLTSFATRRMTALGDGEAPLFTATVRLTRDRADLPSYSLVERWKVPGPEGLTDLYGRYGEDERIPPWWRLRRPVDIRHTEPPSYLAPEQPPTHRQTVWWRVAEDLGEYDDLFAAAVTAYTSDMSVIEPVFRQSGASRHLDGSRILSLTHNLVLHRVPRLEAWMQMDCEVAALSHGRARGTAEIHGPEGHLASFTQLALVKLGGRPA
ncbi:acyl-CoA thioesterase [Nocardioides insulae]|uniref:acyl-CoA thioesterase n=1 Tax=Nocardioides insulae TaxID=394734 RepID=UPI000421A215|nr:acyl-CoA thioesterase domain-containing protein [Nocardioides insulae]